MADRGNANHMTWMENTIFFDATNPGAQEFVWERCRENYYKKGIRCFWLDEAEPEYGPYDFDNYRYYEGPALQCTNYYPVGYAKGFYEGLRKEGETDIMSLVRCAWGAFCPVFRMHGERSPWYEREQEYINGVRQLTSGQDNEVWSFGEDNYDILKKYLFIRERLRPYIRECMKAASEKGAPVMRSLFFDFPEDEKCWEVEDVYMFGADILVAPVMEEGARERTLYLPAGCQWTDANTKKVHEGGAQITVPAPLDIIPVMVREGRDYPIYD